jgi:hypothetical protein
MLPRPLMGLRQVEFRKGIVEELPVDDGWADAQDEIRAVYYNNGDLQFGGDMHCLAFTGLADPSVVFTGYGIKSTVRALTLTTTAPSDLGAMNWRSIGPIRSAPQELHPQVAAQAQRCHRQLRRKLARSSSPSHACRRANGRARAPPTPSSGWLAGVKSMAGTCSPPNRPISHLTSQLDQIFSKCRRSPPEFQPTSGRHPVKRRL